MYSKTSAALAALTAGLLLAAAPAGAQNQMSGPSAKPAPEVTPSSGRRPEVKLNSATAHEVSASETGLARDTLPGAKFITTDEWYAMKDIPKTGLYIVDRENVPNGLAQELKAQGFRLSRDGTLTDAKGRQRAAFVGGQMFASGYRRQGSLLERIQDLARESVIPSAHAGNPYWFACWSTHYMAVYDNGFCRSQTLTVWDDAWGPNSKGTCSGSLPHTNITNLQVRANISNADNGGSEHICKNANHCSTTTEWDIGCWWPAYGSTELSAFWSGTDKDTAHGNPSHQASKEWFH